MTVSVIVHNINRASALERCLRSVAAQTHRPLELVLMDAGSTDASDDVVAVAAADLVSKGITVRSEKCPQLGVAASRNYAAKRASSQLLCFLDNDAAFEDDSAISRTVSEFESQGSLGVLSFRVYRGDSGDPDPTAWVFRRPRSQWFARAFDTFTFTGTGFCVRADAFGACGGFWDYLRYAREEEELGMALVDRGWRIVYAPAVSIRHYSDARGRASLAQRRHIELRNGLLVLWRTLPMIIALPTMAARIASMAIRSLVRERHPLRSLLPAVPEAIREWRNHSLKRRPIRLQSVLKYARLHRVR